MHDRMNDSATGKQHSPSQQAQSPDNTGKKTASEYIDFEEIK